MPIEWVDAADIAVEHLVAVIYGPPNVGKTTLALTSKKPLILDFGRSVHRAGNKTGKAAVAVRRWEQVNDLTLDDLEPFSTVIVDTAGSCIDVMGEFIMREDAKNRNGAALSLKGWGVLKTQFRSWLNMLRSAGLDVVLVAHGIEEQRGDDTMDRIEASGSSKQEIYQQADIIGRYTIVNGERVLTFNPTQHSFAKNVGLEDRVVREPEYNPDVMGEILDEARALIDTATTRQVAEHERVLKLRRELEALDANSEAFDAKSAAMQEAGASRLDARLLLEVARGKGLDFDRDLKRFFVVGKGISNEDETAACSWCEGEGCKMCAEDAPNAPESNGTAPDVVEPTPEPEQAAQGALGGSEPLAPTVRAAH